MTGTGSGHGLPDGVRRVLAVVAHPDDESFGLGALPALLSDDGVPTTVLCFTHGEASTLHGRPGDLHTVRAGELARAAREPGVQRVELAGHPDGGLGDIPSYRLTAHVTRLIGEERPSHVFVSDTVGVTGTGTINEPPRPHCRPHARPPGRCRGAGLDPAPGGGGPVERRVRHLLYGP